MINSLNILKNLINLIYQPFNKAKQLMIKDNHQRLIKDLNERVMQKEKDIMVFDSALKFQLILLI